MKSLIKNKLKEFSTTKSGLKKILEVLQAEEKDKHN